MKSTPKEIKCTWPMRKFCIGDPTQPIFNFLALGFCIGGNASFMFRVGGKANFSVFRYQHVGIANTNFALAKMPVVLRRSGIEALKKALLKLGI